MTLQAPDTPGDTPRPDLPPVAPGNTVTVAADRGNGGTASTRRAAADRTAVAAAKARAALANRRAGWQRGAGTLSARGLGRRAAALPPLGSDVDATGALLAPAVDAGTEARVFDAAAAALLSHRLALAITAADRARIDAVVTPAARDFALRRRHLSLPLGQVSDSTDIAGDFAHARTLAQAEWASRLPQPLAGEYIAAHGLEGFFAPPAIEDDADQDAVAAQPADPEPQGAPGPTMPARPITARGLVDVYAGPVRDRLQNRMRSALRRAPVVAARDPAAIPASERPARALDDALGQFAEGGLG